MASKYQGYKFLLTRQLTILVSSEVKVKTQLYDLIFEIVAGLGYYVERVCQSKKAVNC